MTFKSEFCDLREVPFITIFVSLIMKGYTVTVLTTLN